MLQIIGGTLMLVFFIFFVCYLMCRDLIETIKVGLGVITMMGIGIGGLMLLVNGILKLNGGG